MTLAETTALGVDQHASPTITLPKGGGAVRGIGEKFATNPVTGTGSMTVPIATSPGRTGFGPQLELSYDSGSGNGVFGLGWSLSLPSITRRTEPGLPEYHDGLESDVFILSGTEDLVPVPFQAGEAPGDPDVLDDLDTDPRYAIRRYRPRVDGLFARIERWTRRADGDVHWRSISAANVLTIFGLDRESRISQPQPDDLAHGPPPDAQHRTNPRIFSWLISETRDDRGNAIIYRYKADDGEGEGFDPGRACERNRGPRTDPRRRVNRYLKRILYGNRQPLLDARGRRPRFLSDLPAGPGPDWMFEVVLDYGEHAADAPAPDDSGIWAWRADPFSSYRAGFEVRTTRLCRRVMMFHRIPASPDGAAGYNGLVSSTDFGYRTTSYTCLSSVTRTGYRRTGDAGGYVRRALPPLEFEYTEAVVQQSVREAGPDVLANLPPGAGATSSPGQHWVDLHGDGLPGLLTEEAGAWYYTRNISPIADASGAAPGMLEFAPAETVELRPNQQTGGGRGQFLDLAGDGLLDLVVFDGAVPGFYEHDEQESWEPFRPFSSRLNRTVGDPAIQLTDLDGDGHADVLLIEDDAFVWHPSLAEAGFGPALRVPRPADEEQGPQLVFADGSGSVHLADLSGDGLPDLVRITCREICYWPNLGRGQFGAKVTMDDLEPFDEPDQFDPKRLRLADIDGSGTTDLIYLHPRGVRLYFNDSGNAWRAPITLDVFPRLDELVSIGVADLLGNGTVCLVWSSSWPADAGRALRYVNLVGEDKPHLLIRTINNLGAETLVRYAPSTKFSLQDKRAGHPWTTRLPFPVHVVERVQTIDRISRNRFVTRYAYHHGYFDGEEREFRGFGTVDQWDTEELGALVGGVLPDDEPFANEDPASHVPPVLTRTWFHTGAPPQHLPDGSLATPPLPAGLSAAEEREALRALKGTMLRQEVYSLDGADNQDLPYVVSEQSSAARLTHARGGRRHAVFTTHPVESLEHHLERSADDPRVQHSITLEMDGFGNVLKSVTIGYGRSPAAAAAVLPQAADRLRQTMPSLTYVETDVTTAIADVRAFPGDHRLPLPAQVRTCELTGYSPTGTDLRYRAGDFVEPDPDRPGRLRLLAEQEVAYQETATGRRRRRTIEWARTLYRADDLGSLLPLGHLEPRALIGESYRLAFTSALLSDVFTRDGTALLADPEVVLGAVGGEGGGYLPGMRAIADGRFQASDPDGLWWVPDGRVYLSPGSSDSADAELAHATQHFFMPYRVQTPFHTAAAPVEARADYDDHCLMPILTVDAVGNRSAADLDYRVLEPFRLTDPNGNITEIAFDVHGLVAGSAEIGLPGQLTGDSLAGFEPDLPQEQVLAFLAAPLADPGAVLRSATSRVVHDAFAYQRTSSSPALQPAVVATLGRELHVSDVAAGAGSPVQVSFAYSDGFGRRIQDKLLAEPGPLSEAGPVTRPRWAGSGWKVFDRKGRPVRRFEPFFSATASFEFDVSIGVSPVIFYDPLGRVVAIIHPDGSYEKVRFGVWQQVTWDCNDTVLDDPRTDPEIAAYVASDREVSAPGWRTWKEQRRNALPGSADAEALDKASAHAGTPVTVHFETLGRPFLTVTDNGPDPAVPPGPVRHVEFANRVELDIEGNARTIRDTGQPGGDPLGRVVMRYSYDLLGRRLHQHSLDAGARWMLPAADGLPLRRWDARGHSMRTEYDPLRRPLRTYVTGADDADPARELLTERLVYGEQHPQASERNLRGAVHLHLDQAGAAVTEALDIKGNVRRATRRLSDGTRYREALDWRPVDDDHVALPPQATAPSTSALSRRASAPSSTPGPGRPPRRTTRSIAR